MEQMTEWFVDLIVLSLSQTALLYNCIVGNKWMIGTLLLNRICIRSLASLDAVDSQRVSARSDDSVSNSSLIFVTTKR
jgi:hypothetical protein